MEVKNRIILPPMVVMPHTCDYGSRELDSYYVVRARGGAGAAIVQYTHTDKFVFDET